MSRVWFWRPQWYFPRWSPVFMGEDEYGRRTVVLGWAITGRIIIALWKCKNPECIKFREEFGDPL